MNAPIIVSPVTLAQLETLTARLGANGTTVTPDPAKPAGEGFTIEGHGIGATASYDAGTLTVTVTHKPFYVPMSSIEAGIRKALEGDS